MVTVSTHLALKQEKEKSFKSDVIVVDADIVMLPCWRFSHRNDT